MKRFGLLFFSLLISVSTIEIISIPAKADALLEVTVRDTDADGRILIDLSYPAPDGDPEPEVSVTANGRLVDVERSGGGSGGGRSFQSLLVNASGFGAQTLEATVRVAGETLQQVAHAIFIPRPVILPGWVDDALTLAPPGLRLGFRFLTIDTVLVNGAPADFGIEKMIPRDGITYSGVILPDTARPGTNLVEIDAIDWRGDTFAFTSRFVYAPNGVLRLGQVFTLQYGEAGSRSGPFYQAESAPGALEALSDAMRPDGRMVKTWRAVRLGTATIAIRRKPHFLQDWETEATVELRVEE
jgi:hypothetical protein